MASSPRMARPNKKDAKDARNRADRAPSVATGLYWPCPANLVLHPVMPLATPIKKGPRACWHECGACGSRSLLAPGIWKENQGMTREQAMGQGLTIL